MNTIKKILIILGACLAVLYPVWVRVSHLHWTLNTQLIINNLFPIFGLAAFSLLWLHAISGVFEPWLRKNFDFDTFVQWTAALIFIFIILHPLLLLTNIHFRPQTLFLLAESDDIWLGIIGLVLLLTYDIGKALKKRGFFTKHWNKILIISTIGFLLTFFHSLALGDDLQSGPLRIVWIFYGSTAILATIYTYGLKRLWG
ncbi:hypothetical protein KW791_02400 [Candidatus Parcubacteria bacterium]|nr:hypothetical protein [Candidatus Parcubacteria bacterium]